MAVALRAETPQDPKSGSKPTATSDTTNSNSKSGPEEADVAKIKEKYWARGNEAEVDVVQNRVFAKRRKLELGVDFEAIYGDPFLSTQTLTASVGYYFDELRSVHLLASKAFVGPSSALTTLQNQLGTTTNTNEPQYYLAGEAHASIFYGKVSLLGLAILHFDAYVSAGLGMMSTQSGNDLLVLAGIGQLLHITRTIGVSLAYKLLWYRETIIGKVGGTDGNLGQNLGTRSNLSSEMLVGVSFLLDPFPEQKVAAATKPQT
jgi:outer membrane beta-barrel protein